MRHHDALNDVQDTKQRDGAPTNKSDQNEKLYTQ
jgi:hypothetical protein